MSKGKNKGRASQNTTTPKKVTAPTKNSVLVFIKNRTKQKQVIQVGEELMSFKAYEKIDTKLEEKEAKEKFSYWISNNTLQIVKY